MKKETRLNKAKQQESYKNFEKEEKMLLRKKRETINKIIDWKSNFLKTGQCKKLLGKNNEILLYKGNWGIVGPLYNKYSSRSYDWYAHWSLVTLRKDGKIMYKQGYKGIAKFPCFDLNQETFQKLSYNYLNSLYRAINARKSHWNRTKGPEK